MAEQAYENFQNDSPGYSPEPDPFPLAPTEKRMEWWQQKADPALTVRASIFCGLKEDLGFYVLNVCGSDRGIPEIVGDEMNTGRAESVTRTEVREILERMQRVHGGADGDRFLVATSGLTTGVPGLVSEEAQKMGIPVVGVVSDEDYSQPLTQMNYCIPGGLEKGDSVDTAVQIADEFLVVGGSGVDRLQVIAGGAQGKPVTMIRGFKGASQELSSEDFPTGGRITYRNPLLKQ